jgi:hypothetical protein
MTDFLQLQVPEVTKFLIQVFYLAFLFPIVIWMINLSILQCTVQYGIQNLNNLQISVSIFIFLSDIFYFN